MGPGQCALLRQGGLVALLETATVCDATEDAGNKLRIVDVAESVEHLIFVAEVEVQPGVESVSVFVKFRRIREIREN